MVGHLVDDYGEHLSPRFYRGEAPHSSDHLLLGFERQPSSTDGIQIEFFSVQMLDDLVVVDLDLLLQFGNHLFWFEVVFEKRKEDIALLLLLSLLLE